MRYGDPRRRRRRKKIKALRKVFEEIIVKKFSNVGKDIVNKSQGAQTVHSRISPRRNTLRHVFIKLIYIKHKERILKASREKQQITYKGKPIRLAVDLSAETLQTRRGWQDIFKVLKEKNIYNQYYFTQQKYHSKLMEKSKSS